MPRGNRQILLTHAEQAINDLKRASENLEFMAEKYGDAYPDYQNACKTIKEIVEQAAILLITLHNEKM